MIFGCSNNMFIFIHVIFYSNSYLITQKEYNLYVGIKQESRMKQNSRKEVRFESKLLYSIFY